MDTSKDVSRRNFLANLGNLLIQFQIERQKKAEADSQAAKPEKSATAEKTLAENPQAQESLLHNKRYKKLDYKVGISTARQRYVDQQTNPDAADSNI